MELLWEQLWKTCVSTFTDAGFLQVLFSTLTVLIAACTKRVRQYIIKKCKDLTRFITQGPDQFTGENSDRYDQLRTELAVLRTFLEAARISVYQFHNGDRFTLSDPIFKVTCSHENVRRGVVPDSGRIKYVLVSTIMSFIAPLMGKPIKTPGVSHFDTGDKGVEMCKYDIASMDYDAYHHHMENLGTKTVYAALLKAHDKKSPLGILVIQYIHSDESESDELIRKNITHIRQRICQIEYLLDEELI